jgi:ABC-2 type transport system permease protein
MNKIGLIIRREYLTRVRKRSFIIMTILGPVLFAGMLIVPAMLAMKEDTQEKVIAVVDETNILEDVLTGDEYLKFEYIYDTDVEDLKVLFPESGYYAILYIPTNVISNQKVMLYSDQQTTLNVSESISRELNAFIRNVKLRNENVPQDILKRIQTNIRVETLQWTSSGEEQESSAGLATGIGYVGGFAIYMFVFMFGAMVMRGVIEEKTSRIVEVIISSVKPFQLMMGKVIGIGLVGLTQFVLWILLTAIFLFASKGFIDGGSVENMQEVTSVMEHQFPEGTQEMITSQWQQIFADIWDKLKSVNFTLIIGAFIFYFLGGYLLYSSLFAAIGSAVDNETDTQQFMFPITIPIIIGIIVMTNAIQAPHAPLAFWFSMIPLTSPIVMMARLPFGVDGWELVLSGGLLIITFIGSIWLAGKIYRTGILMYGKKVNYAELWKWIKYKN